MCCFYNQKRNEGICFAENEKWRFGALNQLCLMETFVMMEMCISAVQDSSQ